MKIRIYSMVAVVLAIVIVIPGCRAGKNKELIVLCGRSFVAPAQVFIEQFQAETGSNVATASADSEDFLPLVKIGKQGDVLITHDPYLDYVREADAYLDSAEIGFVIPVLAVKKGNPKKIQRIEDLAKDGLKVGLMDPQYSICGEMVLELLDKKRIKDAVLKNVGNRLTKGHSKLETLMQTGATDAVIMWNGVAHNCTEHLEVVPTPYEYDTVIRVHIIGLKYSGNANLTRRFVSLARERAGAIFASYGYTK